jgi:methionyl-tRNA formyltransferase
MRVLYLGPDSPVVAFLGQAGDDVTAETERIDDADAEFIVSFGYRHVLRPPLVKKFRDRAINLHLSYLPWNRGADPNLWSWIEGTPKGVTIHYIDEGIDTGDIIAQRKVQLRGGTLASTYSELREELINLFIETWPTIRERRNGRRPQSGSGSFHLSKDRARFADLLTRGWHTPVAQLQQSLPRKDPRNA